MGWTSAAKADREGQQLCLGDCFAAPSLRSGLRLAMTDPAAAKCQVSSFKTPGVSQKPLGSEVSFFKVEEE
jgi:hypothetical protein